VRLSKDQRVANKSNKIVSIGGHEGKFDPLETQQDSKSGSENKKKAE